MKTKTAVIYQKQPFIFWLCFQGHIQQILFKTSLAGVGFE